MSLAAPRHVALLQPRLLSSLAPHHHSSRVSQSAPPQAALPLADGSTAAYYAVFDGHGGKDTAQWLSANLAAVLSSTFSPARAEESVTAAFLAADEKLLAPQGFLGLGARGIGGPQCGSTGLVALAFGASLLVANVGDARAVLVEGRSARQLSVDHVPDDEGERYRIERGNPNKKKPLVTFAGETWRVGGLLALSRAFGDAYMKASGEFEGYGGAADDYQSGFGVIAKPHCARVEGALGAAPKQYLVLSSDGLYANEARGGGGGISNERVGEMVAALPAGAGEAQLTALAQEMAEEAVRSGSTDDITILVVEL